MCLSWMKENSVMRRWISLLSVRMSPWKPPHPSTALGVLRSGVNYIE